MLQTEQGREEDTGDEETVLFVSGKNNRKYENAIEETIVLEMNVVDDQESRREQN